MFCGHGKNGQFLKNGLIFMLFAVFFAFFACFLPNSVAFADEVNCTYVVTANSAVVFEQPDFSSTKLATLKNKDEILLVFSGQNPEEFEGNGFVFFKTSTTFETESGQMQGYVLADLVTPKTDVIVSIPHFNAKTNTTCKVFLKENNEISESEIMLEKGTKIFLYEGFNSKSQFTAMAFVHDNQVVYAYLETKNIQPNGVDPLIITCACLILAVLGIIFAWLFMKNKKAKKVKAKNMKK